MSRDGHAHALGGDLAGREASLERGDRVGAAGDHGRTRAVDQGEPGLVFQQRRELGGRERDVQHRASGHGVHQAAPRDEEAERVVEAHHASDGGGDVFACALPEDEGRPDAAVEPAHGGGPGDGEQRRAGVELVVEQRLGGVHSVGRGEEEVPHVAAGERQELGRHRVEVSAKAGVALVERGAHAWALGALAGKDQRDLRRLVRC